MEEIVKIVVSGFSGPLEEFYNDSLEIYRDGLVVYKGIMNNKEESYTITSSSDGFQIIFASLAILIMDLQKNQINQDKSIGGYRIDFFLKDGESHSYSFFGLMDENGHQAIKEVLFDLIPTYEELPKYLDDIKQVEDNKDVIIN